MYFGEWMLHGHLIRMCIVLLVGGMSYKCPSDSISWCVIQFLCVAPNFLSSHSVECWEGSVIVSIMSWFFYYLPGQVCPESWAWQCSLEKRRVNVCLLLGFQIFAGLLNGRQLIASLYHVRRLNNMQIWGEYLVPYKGSALTGWLPWIQHESVIITSLWFIEILSCLFLPRGYWASLNTRTSNFFFIKSIGRLGL